MIFFVQNKGNRVRKEKREKGKQVTRIRWDTSKGWEYKREIEGKMGYNGVEGQQRAG